MDYPVKLLLTRAECLLVLADTQADIDRAQFRLTAAQRANTLQSGEATEDANALTSLNDQITPPRNPSGYHARRRRPHPRGATPAQAQARAGRAAG